MGRPQIQTRHVMGHPQTIDSPDTQAVSLLQLNTYIATLLRRPETQNVWIVAETSDVAVRGGHMYLDLVQKDPHTGNTIAKARATLWAGMRHAIEAKFEHATGRRIGSDIKIMLCVSVCFHSVFGMSLNITDINPEYTLGDLLQRRRRSIQRLTDEGIINDNRQLPWPEAPSRIALISAPGAAGLGDFLSHIFSNPHRLRFNVDFYPAVMQGERAPASVINALGQIMANIDNYDCVVLIRGGGAATDLLAFEDYDLAASIAQYPIPVIIGLGHERDITLLDYVANTRVKTPTAAADILVEHCASLLTRLSEIAQAIAHCGTDTIVGCRHRLDLAANSLAILPQNILSARKRDLDSRAMAIITAANTRIAPVKAKLDALPQAIALAAGNAMQRADDHLKHIQSTLAILSPEATLRRGYTITRINGKAVTASSTLTPGDKIETIFADGSATSQVTSTIDSNQL